MWNGLSYVWILDVVYVCVLYAADANATCKQGAAWLVGNERRGFSVVILYCLISVFLVLSFPC